ncbi:hypothetical protein CPB84DRAFT_1679595 [Gymnopilus junonius]|uniref:Uncharacterized protein n=1 Tax=Gymnopilus junonius TaxID=109634 RepID=A0A9P5NQH7_GYMJU|nr:hypothetical protein CPB84DRAFT_1679595 [Gymnopilus junonius]
MTTANSNNRASLLAGLRTGGVRSASGPIPHTAAPGATFNVSRFPPKHSQPTFPEEEEDDQLAEMPQQNLFSNRNHPMTAAVDGSNNRFAHQQATRGMNPNSVPFSPGFAPNMMPQAQMQMQMLQLEMMRIQAIQAQQYQAELLAQAQLQQQQQQLLQQQQNRRTSLGFNPPATAGPMTNSFDLRAATLSAQMRRANQADQLRSQLGVAGGADDHVPMTAALGGRFGSRTTSLNVPPNQPGRFDERGESHPPLTPNSTTVISGGTSLGSPASNNGNSILSKSDSASSWRRGGANNSVLSGNRAVSSPSVKVTPPPTDERITPPPATEASLTSPASTTGPKFRPQPLRFNPSVSQPLPAVAIDNADDDTDGETHSSGSSVKSGASNSSPTTPRSSSSNETPLSPREEASKRLFEGLGLSRPVSATPSEQAANQTNPTTTPAVIGYRMVSQPTRQPRGPPSGADELGPKNFASRIRRKAIGGLGMLMGARERREFVEAY